MNKDQLMKLYLNQSADINAIKISMAQIHIVVFVQDNPGCTTRAMAKVLNITVANSSVRLARLFMIGYLTRTEITADTGGLEYEYYSVI